MSELALILSPVFFLIALVYAAVGLGGGSAYLAVLVLSGVSYSLIPSTALSLNLIVSSGAFYLYWKAGYLRPRLLLPFVLTSIPAAFLGGLIPIGKEAFILLLGLGLLLAALRIFWRPLPQRETDRRKMKIWWLGLPLGTVLGILAGLVGMGGGVLLSPVLLLLGWARPKEAAAVASAFIFLNSSSGLVAHSLKGAVDLGILLPAGIAVLIGGQLGARWGSHRWSNLTVQRALSVILLGVVLRLFLR